MSLLHPTAGNIKVFRGLLTTRVAQDKNPDDVSLLDRKTLPTPQQITSHGKTKSGGSIEKRNKLLSDISVSLAGRSRKHGKKGKGFFGNMLANTLAPVVGNLIPF